MIFETVAWGLLLLGFLFVDCFKEGEGGGDKKEEEILPSHRNKSMEQRLNLSRSQCKDCSHAYNTPFLS